MESGGCVRAGRRRIHDRLLVKVFVMYARQAVEKTLLPKIHA